MYTDMDIEKWEFLKGINPQFKKDIKSVYVFGFGYSAFLITKDDRVYGLGINRTCSLALPPGTEHVKEPIVIEELCKLGPIKQFSSGRFSYEGKPENVFQFVTVLTKTGKVFSFGTNQENALGRENIEFSSTPSSIGAEYEPFVQIASGISHSVALSGKGKIYTWGDNANGQSHPGHKGVNLFRLVTGDEVFQQTLFKSVDCSDWATFGLSINGNIYGWGENKYICKQSDENVLEPVLIPLPECTVEKIVCGSEHTLALCNNGEIFGWGSNEFGQLGTEDTKDLLKPTRTAEIVGRTVDLGASWNMSVAQSHNGDIYLWGQCIYNNFHSPVYIPYTYMYDVFPSYGKLLVTPTLQSLSVTNRMQINMKKAFDNLDSYDLKLIVDNRPIYVHKAILEIRSNHFYKMLEENCLEGDKFEIVLEGFSYDAYKAFLYYFYSDEIDIQPNFSPELLALAGMYMEDDLKERTFKLTRSNIDTNNVLSFYSCALGHKLEDLEDVCLQYISLNFKHIIRTPDFIELNSENIKSMLSKAAEKTVTKRSSDNSNTPILNSISKGNRVVTCMKEAFDNQDNKDLKIIVDKKPIHVYKAVLKIRSNYFYKMFEEEWRESDKNEIELRGFSYEAYKAFLYYLYTDDIEIESKFSAELLALANMYLEDELKERTYILTKNSICTVNVINFYICSLEHKLEHLENDCLEFIVSNLKEVIVVPDFTQLDSETMKNLLVKAGEKYV